MKHRPIRRNKESIHEKHEINLTRGELGLYIAYHSWVAKTKNCKSSFGKADTIITYTITFQIFNLRKLKTKVIGNQQVKEFGERLN